MGLEPISVELTDFNKLELLREEEERLTAELADVERDIREALLQAARRDYLMSLSPYYAAKAQEGADASKLKELQSRRQLIHGAVEVVSAQRQQYEGALGAPVSGAGKRKALRQQKNTPGSKSSSFDSFEDFRQSRG
jgi:hypothetical protein